MGLTLLDSSVIAGFLKRDDSLHASAASAVRASAAEGPLIASVITFAELLTGAHLAHHDEAVVRGFFRELVSTIVPLTTDLAERAAELRAHHRALRLPDAIVIATGERHADSIVTADEHWSRVGELRCPVTVI
jgi:predicted nucleic acid-binding protein